MDSRRSRWPSDFQKVTPSGPPPGDAKRSRWAVSIQQTLAQEVGCSGARGRSLKPTFYFSVGSPSAGWDSLAEWAQCDSVERAK